MAGTSPAMTEGLFGRQLHAYLAGDAAVVLDAAVAGEVEDGVLVEFRVIEIDGRDNQFVVLGRRGCDDLAVRMDDAASAEQREAVFDAAFRGRDHEGGVLVSASLHREVMVEQALLGALL